jgi:NAD(P)-dependent dehydrogenase (short-subunit alcohol dehydrogenase family)
VSPPRGVIVTGGSGVLGRAVVLHLLRAGSRVAVPYRGEGAWDALRDAAGPGALLYGQAADMASPTVAASFVEAAARFLDVVDGVAACAGAFVMGGTLEKAPVEEWDAMLHANLATAWATARAALPSLLKQGGSLVFVGSRLAETAGAGASAYAVSKSGVHALTRVLALENKARGVRVNAILPGIIDTPDNRKAMPDADRQTWASPESLARVVAFLLSPDSAPMTGALVPVDASGVRS